MAKRRRLDPLPTAPAGAPPPGDGSRAKQMAPIAHVAAEAAGEGALREAVAFLDAARADGRLLVDLPLGKVEALHLERDRLTPGAPEEEEMAALIASLRDRGQQVPIDVVPLPAHPSERYGLVSGLRRLTALRHLWDETGDERFGRVRARVLPRTAAPDAYRAMVEENEIRAGTSFWERGRVIEKAVEAGAFPDRPAALKALFGSVSRAKRSKVGSFARLVAALDGTLRFPAALSEKRGLALLAAVEGDVTVAPRLRAAVAAAAPADAEAEWAVLQAALAPPSPGAGRQAGPRPGGAREAPGVSRAKRPGAAPTLTREGDRLVIAGADASLEHDLRAWLADR